MSDKLKGIKVDIGLKMQNMYDDLILYRNSINAQIEVLAKSPSICTHRAYVVIDDGVKMCRNCNKVISSGVYDHVE